MASSVLYKEEGSRSSTCWPYLSNAAQGAINLLCCKSTLLARAALLVAMLETHFRHKLQQWLLSSHWLDHITRHCCLVAQEKLCSPESYPDVSAFLCHAGNQGRKCCLCQDWSSGPSLCFLMGLFGPPGLCTEAESFTLCFLFSCPQVWQSRTASSVCGREACEDPRFLHKLAHSVCVRFVH